MYKDLFLKIIIAVFLLFLLYFFWEDIQSLNIQELLTNTQNQLKAALIIIGLLMVKSIFFFLPIPLVFLSAGMVLPAHLAVVVCSVGLFFEISLTYFYGYFLGKDFVQRLISRDNRIMKKLESNNDILAIFFLRLAPVAVEPVSLIMGAGNRDYWHFAGASIMGLMPKMIIFIMIGDTLKSTISIGKIITFIILISMWFAGTTLLKKNYVDKLDEA